MPNPSSCSLSLLAVLTIAVPASGLPPARQRSAGHGVDRSFSAPPLEERASTNPMRNFVLLSDGISPLVWSGSSRLRPPLGMGCILHFLGPLLRGSA
jgi:hypothetical protein